VGDWQPQATAVADHRTAATLRSAHSACGEEDEETAAVEEAVKAGAGGGCHRLGKIELADIAPANNKSSPGRGPIGEGACFLLQCGAPADR
jgi:hypothetical protein